VDPDKLIGEYGADTARLFSLFASPPERDLEWSGQGVDGSFRFLSRVWRLVHGNHALLTSGARKPEGEYTGKPRELKRLTHKTIKKVTEDIDGRFHFNTAIAAVMELVNALYLFEMDKSDPHSVHAFRESVSSVVLLMSPFAPHICCELWGTLGHPDTPERAGWPSFEPGLIEADEMLIVAQVNGKLRDKFTAPADMPEEAVKEAAARLEKVSQYIGDKPVRKVIYVKGKLVNIVV